MLTLKSRVLGIAVEFRTSHFKIQFGKDHLVETCDYGTNPCDSVNKSEALLRKGKDAIGPTLLVDQILYVVLHQSKAVDSDDLSRVGLRGNTAT